MLAPLQSDFPIVLRFYSSILDRLLIDLWLRLKISLILTQAAMNFVLERQNGRKQSIHVNICENCQYFAACGVSST